MLTLLDYVRLSIPPNHCISLTLTLLDRLHLSIPLILGLCLPLTAYPSIQPNPISILRLPLNFHLSTCPPFASPRTSPASPSIYSSICPSPHPHPILLPPGGHQTLSPPPRPGPHHAADAAELRRVGPPSPCSPLPLLGRRTVAPTSPRPPGSPHPLPRSVPLRRHVGGCHTRPYGAFGCRPRPCASVSPPFQARWLCPDVEVEVEAMREVVRTVRALRDVFRLGAARPRGEWPRWLTGGWGKTGGEV